MSEHESKKIVQDRHNDVCRDVTEVQYMYACVYWHNTTPGFNAVENFRIVALTNAEKSD